MTLQMTNHLLALLKKNWILWKRNLCCSFCEILLPIALIWSLISVRYSVDQTTINQISYIDLPWNLSGPMTLYPFLQTPQNNTYYPKTNEFPMIKQCQNTDGTSVFRGGQVAIIPGYTQNKIINKIQTDLKNLNYTIRLFESKNDLDKYIKNDEYGFKLPYLCFGVEFREDSNGNYTYALHYNNSGTKGDEEVPFTNFPSSDPLLTQDQKTQDLWFQSGFLTLQNYIDNLIIQQESGISNIQITPSVTSVRTPAYVKDDIVNYTLGTFGIYLVIPLIVIYLRMTYQLLYEKEKKLKEGMKMMGLQDTSFYLSWIITYLLIYTITSVLAAYFLVSNVFTHTPYVVVWLIYWLFCVCLIFQSLFISVFFTKALQGLIIAIVFYLAQFLVISVVNNQSQIPSSTYWGGSVSPHAAFSFAFDIMIIFEGSQQGEDFTTLNKEILNLSLKIPLTMLILNIIFYALLGWYLEQVFPNEWGNKKNPLFFLECFFNKGTKVQNVQSVNRSNSFQDREEEVENMLIERETKNECVQITNLYKTYSSGKQAVSNLSLTMYEGQIFALLGHNGAGKTTTISMLTGMIDISNGSAKAYGKDVGTQIDEIRKFMGVCPQHDILFDDLTVREHLEMFATFKGMDPKDIPAEIQKHIEDVDLVDKTDYLSKNLSGGQKRRLSVAIAFIGGSKLIYLDEPTSGMDTSARRYIWQMLKNYKSQKIVVLTTHFMDEADFLGDRIGIMGEGKLLCCGSSVFLKSKFGEGYNLTMIKKNQNVESGPIIEFVKSHIDESKMLSCVSAEIAFQLPIQSMSKFPQMFNDLDKELNKLQVNSYGISVTTLEEVFLKVAQIGAGHQQVEEFMKDEIENKEMNIIDDFDMNSIRITNPFTLLITHTIGLLIKRMRYFRRDLRSLCCEILLPCLIVVCGLALMTVSFVVEPPEIIISAKNFEWKPSKVYWAGENNLNLINYIDTDYIETLPLNLTSKNISDSDSLYFQKYDLRQGLGWYLINNDSNNNFNYLALGNTVQQQAYPLLVNQMNQAILRKVTNNKNAKITLINSPFVLPNRLYSVQSSVSGFFGAFVFSVGMSFIPASVISYIVKEREINIKHQQLVSGVSVTAYWFSNFILDVVKHIVPAIFCSLMVLAFKIDSMNGANYGATWLLFFLYGWAVIPFSYALGFFFKQQGNALLINFFLHLVFGAIISIIFWVLRLIESTRDASKSVAWILRIIPSFSFAFGIINMSNQSLYATVEGYKDKKDVYDFDIAGGDILFLGIEGFVYFILVFILEKLEDSGKIQQIGSHEQSIPYEQKILDDDVVKENQICETLDVRSQAVVVRDIRKVFMLPEKKHKVAVDKVSFSVGNGEVFGLLGVNGAGKTTTFKMLSGEIKPTQGNAWVAGEDIINQMHEARKNMGYCPQFDALLENLTVQEHLELFTVIKGIPSNLQAELVSKKLKEMDLERFKYIQSGQLSGGNKRKLSVAIAMIGNPPIVFLDEPSTGMDPEARRFMWNVISRIATERKQSSVILTTHSMEEAEALSTKIAIQVDGSFRCIGSVQHIKNKFGQGYEVEVKMQKPSQEEIKSTITKLGREQNPKLDNLLVNEILGQLGVQTLMHQISPKGFGSHIYHDLQKQTGISIEVLVEFILIEEMGKKLTDFIQLSFGEFEVIEHFQTFYRFKIKAQISVGKLFGDFEQNKKDLKISQYSIRQATIEQIFNNFANQSLELEEVKPELIISK